MSMAVFLGMNPQTSICHSVISKHMRVFWMDRMQDGYFTSLIISMWRPNGMALRFEMDMHTKMVRVLS